MVWYGMVWCMVPFLCVTFRNPLRSRLEYGIFWYGVVNVLFDIIVLNGMAYCLVGMVRYGIYVMV